MNTTSSIAKYGSLLLLPIGIYMLDTFVALIHDVVVASQPGNQNLTIGKQIMPGTLHIPMVLLLHMSQRTFLQMQV
jgi:hypothetical protein